MAKQRFSKQALSVLADWEAYVALSDTPPPPVERWVATQHLPDKLRIEFLHLVKQVQHERN